MGADEGQSLTMRIDWENIVDQYQGRLKLKRSS